MENNQPQKPSKEPSLEDVGTRYEHLRAHYESLTACVESLEARGVPISDPRLYKLAFAAEVVELTIDAYAGYQNQNTEYSLYKLINSIPEKGDLVEGGRGTPLCK